eukprot:g13241.t1
MLRPNDKVTPEEEAEAKAVNQKPAKTMFLAVLEKVSAKNYEKAKNVHEWAMEVRNYAEVYQKKYYFDSEDQELHYRDRLEKMIGNLAPELHRWEEAKSEYPVMKKFHDNQMETDTAVCTLPAMAPTHAPRSDTLLLGSGVAGRVFAGAFGLAQKMVGADPDVSFTGGGEEHSEDIPIAVKVFPLPAVDGDITCFYQSLKELAILQSVLPPHPNIVKYHGFRLGAESVGGPGHPRAQQLRVEVYNLSLAI